MAMRHCDGIGCTNQRPDSDQDRGRDGSSHRGWIELSVDGARYRFCSWDCVAAFANDRLHAIAGD